MSQYGLARGDTRSQNERDQLTCIFGIARVSSADQAKDDKDGPRRQLEKIRQFILDSGYKIYSNQMMTDVYTGVSSIFDRPQFAKAFRFLTEVCVDSARKIIVFENSDRIARDLIEGEMLLRQCKQHGIEVWSVDADCNMCDDDERPEVRLMRQVMGAFAEFDKNKLVYRMRCGRQAKRKETDGRQGVEGRRPYGFKEGELEVVKKAYALRYESGAGWFRIASILNEHGHRRRDGGLWDGRTLKKIMCNPRVERLLTE